MTEAIDLVFVSSDPHCLRLLEGARFREATKKHWKIYYLGGLGNKGPEIIEKHKETYIFRREQTVLCCVSR